MVLQEPTSHKPMIHSYTMSSSTSPPNQTFHIYTQPISNEKPLVALNIIAQINKKSTPLTFPHWCAQFQALLLDYDLLEYVNGTKPNTTPDATPSIKTH